MASIIKSMHEYAITPEELHAAFAASGRRGRSKAGSNTAPAPAKPRTPVAPKYRHPESGETWSGHGRAPRWHAQAEAQGEHRDGFLITR